jgi:hypothetical protein
MPLKKPLKVADPRSLFFEVNTCYPAPTRSHVNLGPQLGKLHGNVTVEHWSITIPGLMIPVSTLPQVKFTTIVQQLSTPPVLTLNVNKYGYCVNSEISQKRNTGNCCRTFSTTQNHRTGTTRWCRCRQTPSKKLPRTRDPTRFGQQHRQHHTTSDWQPLEPTQQNCMPKRTAKHQIPATIKTAYPLRPPPHHQKNKSTHKRNWNSLKTFELNLFLFLFFFFFFFPKLQVSLNMLKKWLSQLEHLLVLEFVDEGTSCQTRRHCLPPSSQCSHSP